MQTLFCINSIGICSAVRADITQNGNTYSWKYPRKRKINTIRPNSDSVILLEGNAPFHADSESAGTFRGNACFNFIGEIDVIKATLQNQPDKIKSKILIWNAHDNNNPVPVIDNPVIAFPEIEARHAVVDRYKSRLGLYTETYQ